MTKRRRSQKTTLDALFHGISSSNRDKDAGKALAKVDGIHYAGGANGVVQLDEAVAELTRGADDGITIRADAAMPRAPVDAICANGAFPDNLRFARDSRGDALVADTRIDGAAHLPRTIGSIRTAMIRTLQGNDQAATDPVTPPVSRQQVQEALDQLAWSDEGVVEQEEAWELRPQLRGRAVPVRMIIEAGGLRMSRTVLESLPDADSPASVAVADQALQINGCLRHARLAIVDGRLYADARLDTRRIQAAWIDTTVRAVAVAACHATTTLRLLADQPAVAAMYIMMLRSSVEHPAPPGAGG